MVKVFCLETKMSDIHYKCGDYYLDGKTSLNKFQAVDFWLSPLKTTNWALSAWIKHENIFGGIESLSLVIWVTCGMVTFHLPNLTPALSQAGESQHKCLTHPSQWWYVPTHSKYPSPWKQGWLRMCRTSPSGVLAHAQAQKKECPFSL